MHYRPEIDGLRAVAVIPVILFHGGFAGFQGGFVGVDVFFVISGYLITTLLVHELQSGSFSLLGFYERRARRILPALFLMMAISVPLAWLLMAPPQLDLFAKSLLAVLAFGSNILFWQEESYFAPSAEENPLLHTWSLAAEEQFYLLYPLALMALWGRGERRVLGVIVAVAVASLALSHWGAQAFPSANFYLLPSRAWELLVGAIVALALRGRPGLVAGRLGDLAAFVGLVAIAAAVLLFDEATPFPSLYALLPVVGTALVILFARGEGLAGGLLRLSPVVGLGLLSYSAYLWHQPLFAFARIADGEMPSVGVRLALAVFSFVLAYFSWRFVETPVRARRDLQSWSLLSKFALAAMPIALFATVGIATGGFKSYYLANRLSPQEVEAYERFQAAAGTQGIVLLDDGRCRFSAPLPDEAFEIRFRACAAEFGKAVVVLGDSHAMNLHNMLVKAGTHLFIASLVQGGCRPQKAKPKCQYEAFAEFLTRNRDLVEVVLYHQSGSYFLRDRDGKVDSNRAFDNEAKLDIALDYVELARAYVERISELAPVVWVGPFAEARVDLTDPKTIIRVSAGEVGINPKSVEFFRALDQKLAAYVAERGERVRYRSLDRVLGIGADYLRVGDCITYRDRDHFSACGEDILAARLKAAIASGFLKPE